MSSKEIRLLPKYVTIMFLFTEKTQTQKMNKEFGVYINFKQRVIGEGLKDVVKWRERESISLDEKLYNIYISNDN